MKDVGRHTYLARRKGTANWQFRARVPLDLVAHLGRREITKSLGTADLAEAKRRVRDEADAFDHQCRALRERLVSDDRDTIGTVPFTSLSEDAVREMAVSWFDGLNTASKRQHEMALLEDRDVALQNLGEDERDLTDPDDLGLDGTYQEAIRLLRANDIRLVRHKLTGIRASSSALRFAVAREDAASSQFRLLLGLLRRGRLEDLRRSQARWLDDFREVSFDRVFAPRTEPNGKTLAQMIAAFRAEPERAGQITKLQQTYDAVFRLAAELFGADRPIRDASREDCKAFRSIVQALPPNATKRFPGKSLVDVAKLGLPEADRLRPSTMNHYIDSLATLFNYAESERWISQNPAKRLALKG